MEMVYTKRTIFKRMVDNSQPICYNEDKKGGMSMFDVEKQINRYGDVRLELGTRADEEKVLAISKALSHPVRLQLLKQLLREPCSITELAKLNKLTNSTVIFHLGILEEAGLVVEKVRPNKKGKTLVFYINFSELTFSLKNASSDTRVTVVEQSVGVGNYISASPVKYIRLATDDQFVVLDKEDAYNPQRFEAKLICMDNGEVTYAFSNAFAKQNTVRRLEFSLELSSESPYYCNDWKSEIVFSVCGIDVAEFLSLGDFGDKRGLLSPAWWDSKYSQYGVLVTVTIDDNGVMLNGERVNHRITLAQLELEHRDKITFSLRTEMNRQYAGGFNIYGRRFGNVEQDIVLRAHII